MNDAKQVEAHARPRVTRLAPSPTGALHLGNARTFLITWAIARQCGWKILLRIEDLDTPRVKADAAASIIDTLQWLGMDWDAWDAPPLKSNPPPTPSLWEGASSKRSGAAKSDCVVPPGVLVQSHDLEPYRAAMRSLCSPERFHAATSSARAYACALSRTEIEAAASAPQEGSHETPFPASLRPAGFDQPRAFISPTTENEATNWRFVVPDAPGERIVSFRDEIAGEQSHEPARTIGDFVLWTKRDQPSYQLAVVLDDHRQGVTDVIRGDDLLDSAARQLLLYRALGYAPEPRYWHLPLVIGTDGRRLAKRHGDTRVETYRARGVPPEAVIGLIARWSGVGSSDADDRADHTTQRPEPMTAQEFLNAVKVATIPRRPVTFTAEDDRWLCSQSRRT
jgi:glutamyl-tRNA synthetase